MKTISYKALRLILNVSLILYILGGALMTIFLLGKGLDEETTTFRIGLPTKSYYTLDQQEAVVHSQSSEVLSPALVTNKVGIEFKTDSTYIRSIFIGYGASCYLYSLVIFLFVRAFINSLGDNSVFTTSNVRRLRIIGILLLLVEPLNSLQDYFMQSLIEEYFSHTILNVNGGIIRFLGFWLGSTTASGTFVSSWIIAGLIILVIAEVFKRGLEMKQEQDLTI